MSDKASNTLEWIFRLFIAAALAYLALWKENNDSKYASAKDMATLTTEVRALVEVVKAHEQNRYVHMGMDQAMHLFVTRTEQSASNAELDRRLTEIQVSLRELNRRFDRVPEGSGP